jgi:hypothetical protein
VGSSYKYDAYDPVVVTTEGYGYNAENDVVSEVLGPVVPYRLEFSDQTRFRNLKPGYLLGIRISRAISSAQNPYRGAVGFINLSWTLEAAE